MRLLARSAIAFVILAACATASLEAQSAGCNVGDLYLVTSDGFENLSHHTPLETHRIAV